MISLSSILAGPALISKRHGSVTITPLRSVLVQLPRVAVCGYCGCAPDSPTAKICISPRCPLVKNHAGHAERNAA